MPPRRVRQVIVLLLVAGLILTVALATNVAREKRKLAAAYRKAQATVSQLEQERTHLNDELTKARGLLDSQSTDLFAMEAELARVQTHLAQTQQELTQLQQEHSGLIGQLAVVTQEKHALEARLSSLKELRAAIRSVKQQLRQERWQAWLARRTEQRTQDQLTLSQGNRGFVMRDGSSTLGSRTRLQVHVLEPQTK